MTKNKEIVFTVEDAKNELEDIENEIVSEGEKAKFHQEEVDRLARADVSIRNHIEQRNQHQNKLQELIADKRVWQRIKNRLEAKEKDKPKKTTKKEKDSKKD